MHIAQKLLHNDARCYHNVEVGVLSPEFNAYWENMCRIICTNWSGKQVIQSVFREYVTAIDLIPVRSIKYTLQIGSSPRFSSSHLPQSAIIRIPSQNVGYICTDDHGPRACQVLYGVPKEWSGALLAWNASEHLVSRTINRCKGVSAKEGYYPKFHNLCPTNIGNARLNVGLITPKTQFAFTSVRQAT
ncbi:predicted protein [Sclerotinia sclerotiorum 1980 UF-70]|uniref:Uncharacterized protein n=1 Tax=Sclerotinia sclerotiorum (strain ATCC 18683 / 1980 / Ss-1) TaxID=665079 RepID=A7E514_SCLS1|nr:predicted protein [Sclerotinia sclerotiorum 1980 UF-70]EDN90986.1 predicted protein [Sclerotinia sclerotiorum 1980 UF-70]